MNIENILWDFDGVILDSNSVRDKGFELVLTDFPKTQVHELLDYHRKNGGLSRYHKFRYFFENIRGESVSNEQIQDLAQQFSEIMLKELNNKGLLIDKTMKFIEKNHNKYNMHVVSGSDQSELRALCRILDLEQYFNSIHGSPTPKNQLVSELLDRQKYNKDSTILIGDSINDYEASEINGIHFQGIGNKKIANLTSYQIEM